MAKHWPRDQPPYVPASEDGVTRVVHLKRFHGQQIQDCDVYIGRQNFFGGWQLPRSKWANPFKVKGESDRSKVIAEYRQYVQAKPELMQALHELQGKRLGCWCKPLPCHGDVLVDLVNTHCTEDAKVQQGAIKSGHPERKTLGQHALRTDDFHEEFPKLEAPTKELKDRNFEPTPVEGSKNTSLKSVGDSEVYQPKNRSPDDMMQIATGGVTKPVSAAEKSKRRKHRTPHLHTAQPNSTPRWHSDSQ